MGFLFFVVSNGECTPTRFKDRSSNRLANVAHALEVSPGNFSRLVNGKISLSSDMAVRLSKVLGLEPLTWMRMQADHDVWNAQQDNDHAELKRLAAEV